MSSFGSITSGRQIEHAVRDLITTWAPSYVHEIERVTGRSPGALPKLVAYPTVSQLFKPNGYKGPGFVVVSTGLADAPEKHGGGGRAGYPMQGPFQYRAWWSFTVVVLAAGKDFESTNNNTKDYAAAVRAVVVNHPSLGGVASDTVWLDESYDDLDVERSRTFSGAELVFRTLIENAQTINAGPLSGQPDPGTGYGGTPGGGQVPQPGEVGDWPTVTDVDVDVEGESNTP